MSYNILTYHTAPLVNRVMFALDNALEKEVLSESDYFKAVDAFDEECRRQLYSPERNVPFTDGLSLDDAFSWADTEMGESYWRPLHRTLVLKGCYAAYSSDDHPTPPDDDEEEES